MAEEAKEKLEDADHISICRAENGWKICATFEGDKDKLSVRAGWVPPMCNCKDYVEKTRESVLKRIKEIL
jgi:hypothetical protein